MDVFGAKHGQLVAHNTAPILEISDGLGIFSGTSGVLTGFGAYEPISSVAGTQIASAAGASSSAPSVVGFPLGRGKVVEIALPGFGSSLTSSVSSQELIGRLWAVLSG
jgi:hypothetical protein